MCKMTQSHYELIAKTINDAIFLRYEDRCELAVHFAHVLKETNPKFNTFKFVKAATKCQIDKLKDKR